MRQFWIALFLVGLTASNTAHAQEALPRSTLPLSKILHSLEQRKIHLIKATRDNQQWVVDGIAEKESLRFHLNVTSGGIMKKESIPDLEPVESKLPMSKIVQRMEQASPRAIHSVHFSGENWVISMKRGDVITEVFLDPSNGHLVVPEKK
ncbi:hypothetical protein SH661x_000587 [Planctomicrobium sp. SH661]|uniref:hypothetical protein n=1 Tax=Planctomicrobium sp. SH661 TaxID=3448124 RepID=UPI003F5B4414